MAEASDGELTVVFVCWGNICRSPMAERVAQVLAADRDITRVRFASAATSSEELGAPMDPRADATLRRHGYRSGDHRAHRITAEEIEDADLVVAMEDIHVQRLLTVAPEARHIRLLTDFDPDAEPGSGVPDPWYGPEAGFERTLSAIESAMPGILDAVEELQSARTG